MVTQNPRRAAPDHVRLFLATGVPVFLWGPVGARKNRTVESFGRDVDENGTPYKVITVTPSLSDPSTLHGAIYTTLDSISGETVMRRSIPDIAMQIVQYAESIYTRTDSNDGTTSEVRILLGEPDHRFGDEDAAAYEMIRRGGLTIVLGDELSTCTPMQQAGLLGLLTHGQYGDVDTSPYAAFVLASNPVGTVATANDLSEAVLNRGGHLAWYGDMDLFLEEWGSGFGIPAKVPTPRTSWYIEELLNTKPEEVFRGKWDPKALVPWELFEHSERAVTDLGRMLTTIEEVFAGTEDRLRHTYIVDIAQALLGPTWAGRMAMVTGRERQDISPHRIIDAVRSAGITSATPLHEVREALEESLHVGADGVVLRYEQAETLMRGLVTAATAHQGIFSVDAYLAAWCFALTAPTPGDSMGLHAHMVDLYQAAARAFRAELITRDSVVPTFVEADTRAWLKEAVKAQHAAAPAAAMG